MLSLLLTLPLMRSMDRKTLCFRLHLMKRKFNICQRLRTQTALQNIFKVLNSKILQWQAQRPNSRVLTILYFTIHRISLCCLHQKYLSKFLIKSWLIRAQTPFLWEVHYKNIRKTCKKRTRVFSKTSLKLLITTINRINIQDVTQMKR